MRLTYLIFSLLFSFATPLWAQDQIGQAEPRLTKTPELITFVQAPYPDSESSDHHPVEVVLALLLSEAGVVTDAQVLQSGGPDFDAAAVDAARRFVFSPAEIDGKPSSVKITYRYLFEPPPPAVTTGELSGVLRDRATGKPIAQATVRVGDHTEVVTDSAGAFYFPDLPAGQVGVVIIVQGLPEPLSVNEEIAAGTTTEARYDVVLPEPSVQSDDTDDLEVVVVAPPRLDRSVVSTKIAASEARRLPGTQGDVLKVIDSMPGVGRASAGSGDVVVWGAAPTDTRTYVGAVRIPALYHFGGLRSVVHGDLISDLELIPGGYGAAYGRGLGGIILVETKAPATEQVHGSVQADLLDASVSLTSPLTSKDTFMVAARKSYIANLASLVGDDSSGSYFTVPSYYDGAARFRHRLSQNQWIEVGGLLSGDVQDRVSPSNNPAFRSSDRRSLSFQRADLHYNRQTGEGDQLNATGWYGHDLGSRQLWSSGVEQDQRVESHLGGLRVDQQSRLLPSVNTRVGLDLEVVSSKSHRVGALTLPPREGDPYVFGRAPADELAYDEWQSTLVTAAAYVELDAAPFDEVLHIVPSVRVDPYVQTVNRARPAQPNSPDLATLSGALGIEPRLTIDYTPLQVLSLRAGGGLYRQPPRPDDLSSVFGNPHLEPARGTHLLFGVRYRIVKPLSVEATGFYTRSSDIGSRNPSTTPKVAEALVQEGEGKTIGGQLLARKEPGNDGLHGWIAYTIMRTMRRDSGMSTFRYSDLDQTHVLTAIASYAIGWGVEFGLRARFATGYPRTPVEGAYFDTSRGRYEPILGERNSIRIPSFFQLDARVSKVFELAYSKLEIYLDVQNATNRKNAEELAYSPDFEEQRFVQGLPILPVLGVRWEF